MAVKWGVIGCGGIAFRRTIPEGIMKAANSELAAVMDVNREMAEKAGAEFGAKVYTSEEDILRDKNVEAVYIATPAYLHKEQVIKAAEAGKHVLCEKPLALTLDDCESMISACRNNNVRLGVGFMMRFHSYHKKASEMIKAGLLGKMTFVRAQLSCWFPDMEGAWRQSEAKGGGGSLIDMGNHCIDVLEDIMESRVAEVSCFTGTVVHNYPVEDTAVTLLKFENGVLGVVDSCFSIPDASSKNRLELYGSGGSILAEGTIGQAPDGDMKAFLEESKGYDAGQSREVSDGGQVIKPEPVNTYQAEIEEMSTAVMEERETRISGEDGLWSQKVMLACYESAKTGRAVTL
jgi:predicted dehydrogenase